MLKQPKTNKLIDYLRENLNKLTHSLIQEINKEHLKDNRQRLGFFLLNEYH